MLEGLAEVKRSLEARGIAFVIRFGPPPDVAFELSREAAALVVDRGYLKPQRAWQAEARQRVECRMIEVETDVVVPVEVASSKHEVGARTLRPKIGRLWDDYLVHAPSPEVTRSAGHLRYHSDVDLSDPLATARSLRST
jgi:deoxyribodipyrimidine photo-lyase